MTMRSFAAALPLVFVAAACGDSPERAGDKFIDYYLVEIDQARARPLACGLAAKKLDDEMKLVADVRHQGGRDDARPSIFYTRRTLRVEGERANVTYDVTVKYGGDETHKNAMLSLERSGGRWCVANFTLADGPLPQAPPR
jgi:hypothetical protein